MGELTKGTLVRVRMGSKYAMATEVIKIHGLLWIVGETIYGSVRCRSLATGTVYPFFPAELEVNDG